jgi:hypothetical protein
MRTRPLRIESVYGSNYAARRLLRVDGRYRARTLGARSVAELGAIGRNLNQIARAVNQGGWPSGPGREDLQAMLRVAEALRDHVKALLRANQTAWKQGHAQTTH